MNNLLAYFPDGIRRFMAGLAIGLAIGGISALVGYFWNQNELQQCQADQVELLKQHKADQDFKHSYYYGQKLKQKDSLILAKDEELLRLRAQNKLDSASILSLEESMDAINRRYSRQN